MICRGIFCRNFLLTNYIHWSFIDKNSEQRTNFNEARWLASDQKWCFRIFRLNIFGSTSNGFLIGRVSKSLLTEAGKLRQSSSGLLHFCIHWHNECPVQLVLWPVAFLKIHPHPHYLYLKVRDSAFALILYKSYLMRKVLQSSKIPSERYLFILFMWSFLALLVAWWWYCL